MINILHLHLQYYRDTISGDQLENLYDREIAIKILSEIEYFNSLKDIDRNILSKVEIITYLSEDKQEEIPYLYKRKSKKECIYIF